MSACMECQCIHNEEAFAESKQRIADNFSRAAEHYDQADRLQQYVARRLMLCLPEQVGSVLDLGCGTGKWTYALRQRYRQAQVIGMDFAWGMLQKAKSLKVKGVHWCAGDIETLPLGDNSVDLVFSSLAVQWCSHLSHVLKEAERVLKPGGSFVFSTLAKGSLYEMQHLWKSVDQLAHTNEYQSFSEQEKICRQSPLLVQQLRCDREVFHYDTVMNLLREFKGLGANTVSRGGLKGLMTPAKLQRFLLSYEQLRETKGVPCTYNVVYGVLVKE